MVDTVGNKLRRARALRQISLEDASRATKIRAARLSDLESDVYTNFANIAYAKGFLTSYAKYLSVDVRPHLDAFESTSTFGLDDYQYLSEKPVGIYRAQRRPQRRLHRRRNLLALAAVAVLCATGVTGWFLYVSYQRLGGDKGLSRLAASQEERDRGGKPVAQGAPAPAAASSSSAPTPATVIDSPAPPAATPPAPGLTLPAVEEDGAVQLVAADGPSFLLLNRLLLPWPAGVPAAFTLAADHRSSLAAAPSALALPREVAAPAPALPVAPGRAAVAPAKPAVPVQEGILTPGKGTSAAPDQRYYVHAPGTLDIQPAPANADKKSFD